MGLIDKAHTEAGDFIIREGDNAAFFYALLSGEVEVTTSCPRHGEQRVAVLRAGEDGFFGETELLDERQPQYTHSVRCAAEDGCEVLKLAKSDFEAGFLGNGGRKGKGDAACEKRRRLLGFMQMVTPSQPLQLKQDEVVPGFREGAPADKYYILRSGTLRVEQGGVVLGRIEADNGFGESGLLSKRAKRSKTITCDSEECELVSIAAATFLRLTEKSSVLREMMQEDKDQRMAEWAAIRRQESSAGGEQPPASTGAENAQLGEQSPGLAAAAGGPPKKKKRWLGIW